jgi:protein-S-isoprenylcysteine O-methyltransferase Ste14
MILMGLGTAINSGLVLGVASFVLLCFGFWLKASKEEAMMLKHFPEQYSEYKKRVHALIPFVW